MKCFGMQEVPREDWICDVCKTFGKENGKMLACALCSRKGGVMKKTIHVNDASIPIRNYSVSRILRTSD